MTDDKRLPDLDDLDARVRALRGVDRSNGGDDDHEGPRRRAEGVGLGFRIGIEFVSAVAVGTGMGWALDTWLGTMPWFMVLFLFVGGAAGVMNVYRVVKGMDSSVGAGRASQEQQKGPEGDAPDRPDNGRS